MTTTPDPTPATPSGNDASGHDFSGTDPWAALDAPPAPNASGWVRQQLEDIHAAGTTEAASVEGMRVVVLTMLGKSSRKVREVPLMRVEHDGVYAAVGSKGGSPEHPQWVHNLTAHPHLLLQDGTTVTRRVARLATEAEHAEWWPRCVEAFPPYADYQTKTDRQIPVFLLEQA